MTFGICLSDEFKRYFCSLQIGVFIEKTTSNKRTFSLKPSRKGTHPSVIFTIYFYNGGFQKNSSWIIISIKIKLKIFRITYWHVWSTTIRKVSVVEIIVNLLRLRMKKKNSLLVFVDSEMISINTNFDTQYCMSWKKSIGDIKTTKLNDCFVKTRKGSF